MANVCSTELSVQKTDNTKDWEKTKKDIVEYLDAEYAYMGDVGVGFECEDFMELSCGTRWNVCGEILSEACKKFKVRCRAYGIEPGIGFIQLVHVEDDGNIISDEELGFRF